MSGPLAGLRVVELVGQGPGPFAGMVLADLGADVVAVDRPAVAAKANRSKPPIGLFLRGKRSAALDLKVTEDLDALIHLCDRADVFIDPFRPGVCERLGVGPDVLRTRNERLIYGRITGFGQTGPLAHVAGHDINYIAMSGALHALGAEGGPPQPPINLLGDFAGGGMLLALGVAAAAFERSVSGHGQVIDAAMIDGAALMFTPLFSAVRNGVWGERGTNHLDGGAHFYNTYTCADGEYIVVGAIEPQFYAELLALLGLDAAEFPQHDRAQWKPLRARFAAVFLTKTRDEWRALLEGTEACFAPVLSAHEAPSHPHNTARETFHDYNGSILPGPAPRFSRTEPEVRMPCHIGDHTADLRAGSIW
jgi:alpha-methylacyl-CoA racemase